MKAVILAAGEGVRMQPLTLATPKPMLKVSGKPILEHIINDLPDIVDEVIIVVGYLGDKIINYFGSRFGRIKINYVVQREKLGTYHALSLCREYLSDGEKFLMLYADDLHGKSNLEKCISSEFCSLLVYPSDNPKKFGVVESDQNGLIKGIEEKPENPKTNLVSTGVLMLDKKIFDYPARQHKNGEYYLTDSIDQMIKAGHIFLAAKSDFWLPIGYPEDLVTAEETLKHKVARLLELHQ
ncbi:MAG: hypothetical protein A3J46_00400 [Candidatus Yanofskybacteria bacterium RIFCSPHIGHO2_02_FULL_41_11]|uniref:Nucleotidyl transferase domain-containing protein n=1 Tax=Candidatus Yanofskybacteria bacterium RIFCSPHIGHO2_02_FULL_41_11 TaxID=1802675 RepID=A0A1F8F9I7_9BACT|nr:MAG: hypothetical protein A3J46_00400 [Candidatus Yanofskybacteria bacterium RIFCSPHIGHO2_02_FULL_41_11]